MDRPVRNAILLGVGVALVVAGATAWASAARRLSLDQLVSGADRVVVARLAEDGVSAWGPGNRLIFTTYTFEAAEEIAGSGPQRFRIVQPGGRVGRLAQWTEGYPRFGKGERVLLFLRRHAAGYRVVGLSQGVFGFRRHDARELVYQKLEGLSFPGDAGRPILMDRARAVHRIQAIWRKREAR